MEKVSSQYAETAVVNVYVGDEIVEQVTREVAREMKASGAYFFISHGKDLKRVSFLAAPPTELEQALGWNIPREMRDCGLNRGRVGQFPIGYPIPYAFEGHLTMPKAAIVNYGDPVHKTNSEQLRSCLSST